MSILYVHILLCCPIQHLLYAHNYMQTPTQLVHQFFRIRIPYILFTALPKALLSSDNCYQTIAFRNLSPLSSWSFISSFR